MKKKKKGKFGKWIKKHKIATAIISIILICVLIIAGVIGSILWGLYKDSVGIVDPDDVEMLQDLILAAVNEVMRQVDEVSGQEMGKLTGGLNIPGLM